MGPKFEIFSLYLVNASPIVALSLLMFSRTSMAGCFSCTFQPKYLARPPPKWPAASWEENECLRPPLVHVTRSVTSLIPRSAWYGLNSVPSSGARGGAGPVRESSTHSPPLPSSSSSFSPSFACLLESLSTALRQNGLLEHPHHQVLVPYLYHSMALAPYRYPSMVLVPNRHSSILYVLIPCTPCL